MAAELLEIIDFLRRHPPFAELPEEALRRAAGTMEEAYYKAGSDILRLGESAGCNSAAYCTARPLRSPR